MTEGTDHTGSTPMFAIFILSMYTLYLIPYTLYKLCGSSSDETVSRTWARGAKGVSLVDRIKSLLRDPLFIQWVIYALLFWYTSSSAGSVQQFDPFQILEVPDTATEFEIKKAYRRLSLQYHPDKNPDPKAAEYFANYISKAYQALTDNESRENYQKYGHPDGPQAFTMSVALPEWFLSKDKSNAPLVLLLLLFGGIVGPLALAAHYLSKRDKFTGPNRLMHETIAIYARDPRIGIKESQSLPRIPETLVCAMEFITMPHVPGQAAAMEELRRRVLFLYPDLKAKSAFWKRKPSVVKAHLLLLAHLEREPIPATLQKDYKFVIEKCVPLLREMIGISCAPRVAPGYGWLSPALASVEMLQSIVRAVPIEARRGGKGGDSPVALLQLPGVLPEAVRRLGKKKVKSPQELRALAPEAREAALRDAGVGQDALADVETSLAAMPALSAAVELRNELDEVVDGETAVLGGEVIAATVRLALTRPAHFEPGFDSETVTGARVAAFAPLFPGPKDEQWYFLLSNGPTNWAMALGQASLIQAEACGARAAVAAVAKQTAVDVDAFDALAGDDAAPQRITLAFRAPVKAGRYVLTLHCMSDSWIGADRTLSIRLKVVEPTRAQLEGRAKRSAELLAAAEDSWERVGDSDADNSSAEGSASDEESEAYDSDEYGTEESSDEEDDPSDEKASKDA